MVILENLPFRLSSRKGEAGVFKNLHSGGRFLKDAFSVTVFIGYVWTVGQTREKTKTDTSGQGLSRAVQEYTVFQRPYRYFSIALKVVFSLSDCYKSFTSNWLGIEICENVV